MDRERIAAAIDGAISQRGRNKGKLKRQCPPMGTDAAAAWQALMGYANPYKLGLGHIMFMPEPQRELYRYLDDKLAGLDLRGLDSDRLKLELWRAW